jgi:hypothetical protein
MARCVNTIAAAVHLGSNDASPGVPSTDAAGLLYWVANAAPGGSGRWPAGKQVHEGLAEHWGLDGAGPHGRNADWRRGKRPATWTDWNKGLGNPVV